MLQFDIRVCVVHIAVFQRIMTT